MIIVKIRQTIKNKVFKNNVGLDVIALDNSSLSFSAEFIFLGFTKSGNMILGDVHSSGPKLEDYKWNKRFAKFHSGRFWVNGNRYSVGVEE